MSGIDASGFYYAYNPVNSPDPNNQSGYLFVMARSSSYKKCYSSHLIVISSIRAI